MSDYAPTTEQVWVWIEEDTLPGEMAETRARFDRWLKTVKAEAWDEGWDMRYKLHGEPSIAKDFENPYRVQP